MTDGAAQVAFDDLERSFVPLSLSAIVTKYMDPSVKTSAAYRRALEKGGGLQRCTQAFLEYYSLTLRLDIVDVFDSSEALMIDTSPTRVTVAPEAARPKLGPQLLRGVAEHAFDMLRYGVFLPSRMIMLADEGSFPPQNSDAQNRDRPSADYTFVVLQLRSENEQVIVIPVFQLVFRPERREGRTSFVHVLRQVTVSAWEHMHRYHHLLNADSAQKSRIENQLAASYAPTPLSLDAVEAAATFAALKALWERCVVDALPDCVPYLRPSSGWGAEEDRDVAGLAGERMKRRLLIEQFSPEVAYQWLKGTELEKLEEAVRQRTRGATGTSTPHPHPSCRVVLKETRSGRNSVEEAELCAYLPSDGECSGLAKYGTLAEERIRLWVLKALLTAEVREVHQLLFDLDTAIVIAQCTELLHFDASRWANGFFVGDEERSLSCSGPSLHVVFIVLTTIEDYLRHSGVVWRACVALRDVPLGVAQRLLHWIQSRVLEGELKAKARTWSGLSPTESSPKTAVATVSLPANPAPRTLPYSPPAVAENVVVSAACSNVALTTPQLHRLFRALDRDQRGLVSVEDLLQVFIRKNSDELPHSKRGTCMRPAERRVMRQAADEAQIALANYLLPLDSCGLPESEEDLRRFIMQFKVMDPALRFKREYGQLTNQATDAALVFDEFSMLMLHLAQR